MQIDIWSCSCCISRIKRVRNETIREKIEATRTLSRRVVRFFRVDPTTLIQGYRNRLTRRTNVNMYAVVNRVEQVIKNIFKSFKLILLSRTMVI